MGGDFDETGWSVYTARKRKKKVFIFEVFWTNKDDKKSNKVSKQNKKLCTQGLP